MPTGYTYPVGEGKITTLRQFALLCAREFGACINMRDESLDAPIPERFEPHTKYHDEKIAAARALLAELPTLTINQCDRRAAAEYASALRSHEEYQIARQLENDRYRRMRDLAAAWANPPEGIREFMLQQLDVSISDYDSPAPKCLSGPKWRENAIEAASRDVTYHEQERAKEIARTEDRNAWLAQLRASLPDDGTQ